MRNVSFLFAVILLAGKGWGQTLPERFLRAPSGFEAHGKGAGREVMARGRGYSLRIKGSKAAIGFGEAGEVGLEFMGGKPGVPVLGLELPGKVNYIRGNAARSWRMGVPTYRSVTMREIYPGIDFVFYGDQRQLEFDAVVKPEAEARAIRMGFTGASGLKLNADGDLIVSAKAGELRLGLPGIYQERGGKREQIRGRYVVEGEEVRFAVEKYDKTRDLVIDPTLTFSTVLGGGTNTTVGNAIAYDSAGNLYVTGYTSATDFPVGGAAQSGLKGPPDGFLTKINAAGTAILYSTYFGGTAADYMQAVAVDSTGAAWVTGYSYSSDFPLLNATQGTPGGGGSDAVIAKFTPAGVLAFSTYLGGTSFDGGYGVAIDGSNNAYVTGYTSGGNFPTTAGVLQGASLGIDAFVSRFSAAGTLVYTTLLGGAAQDTAAAIAVDAAGNAYVTGSSFSPGFAGAPGGGLQTANGGGGDGFVAKLNPAGTALLYFTFLGGAGSDAGTAIAVDGSGQAFVGGNTASAGLATAGAAQTALGGLQNGFVAGLNAAGSALRYFSYLGGNRKDVITGLGTDGGGNVYVTGQTHSSTFPVVQPLELQPVNAVSLFQTTNSGAAWAAADLAIPGSVLDISPDPGSASVGVVSTENGIYRTANSGASYTLQSTFLPPYLARSLAVANTIYGTNGSSAYRSLDGGVTWAFTGFIAASSSGVVADPLTGNTAYSFNGNQGIYKTIDGGATWTFVTGLPSKQVQALAASSDGSLYTAVSNYGIYKSVNQGAAWTAVNAGLPSGIFLGPRCLAVSGSTLYLAAGNLYKSTNGGAGWSATAAQPTAADGVAQVAVSSSAAVVYAATFGSQVYRSGDGGGTWSVASAGLPSVTLPNSNLPLTEIVVDPLNGAKAYTVWPTPTTGFVSSLSAAGSQFNYSTYFGGTSVTLPTGLAARANGEVAITGNGSPDLPAAGTSFGGAASYSAFVARIASAAAPCTYSVSPSAPQVQLGTTGALNFSIVAPSGCAWTAVSNQTWMTISNGASGSGVGSIGVQFAANTTGATRTATLTAGGQTITVTQADAGCGYTLTPSSVTLPVAGGTGSANLVTGAGCPWSVGNSYTGAVTVTSAASGTGNAAIAFTVGGNASLNSRSVSLNVGSASVSITQPGTCTFSLSQGSALFGVTGGSGTTVLTTSSNGCFYTVASNASWIAVTTGSAGTTSGTVGYTVAANDTQNPRTGTITVAGLTFTVTEQTAALRFVPVTPCRVLDTRTAAGPFGAPAIAGGTSRAFTIPSSACGIPATAQAYSLNVAVVPQGQLGYLTIWPVGQTQPFVATINSDGRVKSNAAIVPAGTGGAINAFASNTTDLVLDINGYFVPAATAGALAFYPLTPCRIADTRLANGAFGGPFLTGGAARTFPIPSSSCAVPATAQSYSLNFAAVPRGSLGYLTAWPTGQTQPFVASLNAVTGTVTANGAIVPAGASGAIDVFASNSTDLVIDINGYFAPVGGAGLSLYNLVPCRVLDSRLPAGAAAFTGAMDMNVTASPCSVPGTAQAYVFNATVVPSGTFGFLTLWPQGTTQPNVATLNAVDGVVTGNLAVVPANNGLISAFGSNPTYLVLDIFGYFAP